MVSDRSRGRLRPYCTVIVGARFIAPSNLFKIGVQGENGSEVRGMRVEPRMDTNVISDVRGARVKGANGH